MKFIAKCPFLAGVTVQGGCLRFG